MDLAQIGFGVDTSELAAATTDLQKLVPASKAAESAAESVSAALNKVNKAATGATTATGGTTKVMQAAAGATTATTNAAKSAAAANDNLAKSHAGLSTQAMAAQHSIRSMVEQLAMGVPPSQVLTTQLNHLSYAASGPGGLTKAFGDALGSLRGLVGGTGAVVSGIAAIAVGFGVLAANAIKSALALDDLSKSIDVPLSKLHTLQQLASGKGIDADEFAAGMQSFSKSVDEAQHNTGTLNTMMIAAGKSAKDFDGYLANVADLVSQAASGVQKRNILEAASLPITQAWVRLMSQGSETIKAASANTIGFNDAAEKNLIQKARDFDDRWHNATTNVSNYLKSITLTGLDWVDKLLSVAATFRQINNEFTVAGGARKGAVDARFGSFAQPSNVADLSTGLVNRGKQITSVATAATGTPPDPTKALVENQQAQQRISILGDMATVEQQVKQKQLELTAAGLQGVGVSRDMAAAILNNTRAMAEMSRVQQQATAGVYDANAARKAAADTLQSWIDKGLIDKNNVEQMAAGQQALANQLKQTSDAAAIAGAKFQSLKQIELDGSNFAKLLDTSVSGALNSLVSPIQDVMNGVTSLSAGFKNAGVVILKAIQEMIIKMLILAPIAQGLQSIFGGFGGFGSLFGLPSLTKNAAGGVYNSPTLSAYSGQIISQPTMFRFATGAGLMGEAGPEGILPLKRGPSGALGVQMYGGQQAGNDNSMQITYAPTYGDIAPGADPQAIAELRKAQARDRAEFASNVGKTIQNLRKRNVRV
ncbi:hypothetical protein QCM80_28075 [Bradyrhizobium sp. SSUT112]|uniref:phage tail tape measure protein n=1 Tax=Bradyrhizobium sp. SSUT112 TaxID=3040604 RepID=UPI00244954E1|nr:hypothetical protein [Bradyrhizobium sp. SSUT112]MDH2354494.1 hypothetical protein [Bradyrhizobium sp. SSUT112]